MPRSGRDCKDMLQEGWRSAFSSASAEWTVLFKAGLTSCGGRDEAQNEFGFVIRGEPPLREVAFGDLLCSFALAACFSKVTPSSLIHLRRRLRDAFLLLFASSLNSPPTTLALGCISRARTSPAESPQPNIKQRTKRHPLLVTTSPLFPTHPCLLAGQSFRKYVYLNRRAGCHCAQFLRRKRRDSKCCHKQITQPRRC